MSGPEIVLETPRVVVDGREVWSTYSTFRQEGREYSPDEELFGNYQAVVDGFAVGGMCQGTMTLTQYHQQTLRDAARLVSDANALWFSHEGIDRDLRQLAATTASMTTQIAKRVALMGRK